MSTPGPQTLALLVFFRFEHLPPHLQEVSRPFAELAVWLATTLPASAELTVALRRLLEAKDAAVRARIPAADVDSVEAWVLKVEGQLAERTLTADSGNGREAE